MLGNYLGGQGFNGGFVGDIKNMARDFNGVAMVSARVALLISQAAILAPTWARSMAR